MSSWFAMRSSGIYRKMGYFSDQEGIMNRYIREAAHWKAHLQNTKSAILKSCEGKGSNKIAILGSGWLLDVPIDELSNRFDEVWLFDIKHPSQIRRRMEKIVNVRLVETDISGFAAAIYAMSPRDLNNFDVIKPQFDFDLEGFDMVVSCNILNQLDIILVDYLKKVMKIDSSTELYVRKLIQETHISLLPPQKSLLVSDIEELSIDSQGEVVRRKSLVYTDRLLTSNADHWVWHFDNCCAYRSSYNTWFNVVAAEIH